MLTENNKNVKKKILLIGGGTGGSVAPLLAIVDELRNRKDVKSHDFTKYDFFWLGTKNGMERQMVEKEGIKFKPIAFGKLRRYFAWQNFSDIFKIILAFFQSLFFILKWKPDLAMSAGSFVGVPVSFAAWICRIPVLIHQQDARPGLANKLMAPFARVVTVTFEKLLKDYGEKAIWIGNPARKKLKAKNKELKVFNLKENLPVILVMGGGTGAMRINKLVVESLEELTKFCQIIHITGKDKNKSGPKAVKQFNDFYHVYEFFSVEELAKAYACADIVVSRCGMGVLTDLSYLGKPSILIPMPDSHQEDNARIFKDKEAAIVLNQKELTKEEFINNIKKLLDDKDLRDKLSNNIREVIKRNAGAEMVGIIKNLTGGL